MKSYYIQMDDDSFTVHAEEVFEQEGRLCLFRGDELVACFIGWRAWMRCDDGKGV